MISSIGGANPMKKDNTQDVIDGHNDIIAALKESKQARKILFKTQYLNSDTALNNWVPLDRAVPMTRENFRPAGLTPLYDKTLHLLRSVIYEKEEAAKRIQTVRWGILLITDGDDTASRDKAEHVKLILDDMRKTGELLATCEPSDKVAGSIALLGIEDRETDPEAGAHFEKVAHSMGNQHSCRNENVFLVIGQPFRSCDGNFVVVIVRAKQGDEATGIRNDDALINFLHRDIHRSVRTDRPAPVPATPPLVWPTEAMRRPWSHGLRFGMPSVPGQPAPGSLQPQPCSRAWPAA